MALSVQEVTECPQLSSNFGGFLSAPGGPWCLVESRNVAAAAEVRPFETCAAELRRLRNLRGVSVSLHSKVLRRFARVVPDMN